VKTGFTAPYGERSSTRGKPGKVTLA